MDQTASIIFSSEYAAGNTTIAAEYMMAPFDIKGVPRQQMESYYVSIAHRLSGLFEMGGYYSELYPDDDDRDGSLRDRVGLPARYAWYKDLCITLRFDLNYNWIVKLEGHVVDGLALNPGTYVSEKADETNRRWETYLVKVSYNF